MLYIFYLSIYTNLQCNGPEYIYIYRCWNLFSSMVKFTRTLFGPQYNGKYLHRLIREKLGETKLHQTLTNVVIPAFDIKRLQPTIFSSFQVHPFSLNLLYKIYLLWKKNHIHKKLIIQGSFI